MSDESTAIGVIHGIRVHVRAKPDTSSEILTRLNTGDKIIYFVDESYTGSGHNWYRCVGKQWRGVGYIASDFVATGGYSTTDEPVHEDTHPSVDPAVSPAADKPDAAEKTGAVTYRFSAQDAVTYALNHSDNSHGPCPLRNKAFRTSDGHDDCADFISQCICAGGVPMFDGWFYRFPGIPAHWSSSKWTVTYSGYLRLNAKGWLTEVAYDAIRPGDIIYTYKPEAKPTPFPHVTIAVSENFTQNDKFGCNVCGYTANQHQKFKPLTATNCKCYRVNEILMGDGSEKRVLLPASGNGATVLNG